MQALRKFWLLLGASRVRAIPFSAAVILSPLCSPAWAEQEAVETAAVVSANPDTSYSSQETRVYALPELVVSADPDTGYSFTHSGTALGVPIPLEDTPQSVLTIKRQVLEDQLATTLWDGLKNVSGVFSRGTNSAVSEDFVIRGFRLDPRRNYYHNGVPYYNRFAAEPGNLERVEVLKGPASILYGAIEPGGDYQHHYAPTVYNLHAPVAPERGQLWPHQPPVFGVRSARQRGKSALQAVRLPIDGGEFSRFR